MRALMIAALLVFGASTARAADLMNFDNKAYKFGLKDGSTSSKSSIRANGSMSGLCTPNSQCVLTLGGKSVPFNSNSKLVIKNGKPELR